MGPQAARCRYNFTSSDAFDGRLPINQMQQAAARAFLWHRCRFNGLNRTKRRPQRSFDRVVVVVVVRVVVVDNPVLGSSNCTLVATRALPSLV